MTETPDKNGWLPIETFDLEKRDIIPVLIWDGEEVAPAEHHGNGRWIGFGGEDFYTYEPTHWQPFPAPPEINEKTA